MPDINIKYNKDVNLRYPPDNFYHLRKCPFCDARIPKDREDVEQLLNKFIPTGITFRTYEVVEDYECKNCKRLMQFSFEQNTIVTKADRSTTLNEFDRKD